MATDEQLTAKKIAEKLGVSEKKVKDEIAKAGIEPDSCKGPCKYYGPAAIKKLEKALK